MTWPETVWGKLMEKVRSGSNGETDLGIVASARGSSDAQGVSRTPTCARRQAFVFLLF